MIYMVYIDGQHVLVKKLIEIATEDKTLSKLVNAIDNMGRIALHYAIFYASREFKLNPSQPNVQSFDFIKALSPLGENINLDQEDNNGVTPLILASYRTFL